MEMTIHTNEAQCLEFRFELNAVTGELLSIDIEQLSKKMQHDIILAAKKISNAFVDTGNLTADKWWEKRTSIDYGTLPVVWCQPYALEAPPPRKRRDGSYYPLKWRTRFTVTVQRWQVADPDGFAEFWNETMNILNSNRSKDIKIKLTVHINTNSWEVDLKIP